MVAYTSALLAAANLLALAHAAPAQPVCQAVITVITGSPIWVPRPDPTTSAGWGAWSSKGSSASWSTSSVSKSSKTTSTWSVSTASPTSGGGFYPVTSTTSSWTTSVSTTTSASPSTTTVAPTTVITTSTTPQILTTTTTPPPITTTTTSSTTTTTTTTTTAIPQPSTCAATGHDVFSAGSSGSCGCDFTVNCNKHAPYTSDTQFWERKDSEIIETLQECLNICNDNSACQAVVWSNQDGESSQDYKRCWQTSGLPQPDSDGYGQLSYKGACSSSCSNSYSTSG